MVSVGIRDLRNSLSNYLERARAGERIIVTMRGEEIAELGPLSEDRRTMNTLVAEGRVKWEGGKPDGLEGVSARGGPVSDTVIEDRR